MGVTSVQKNTANMIYNPSEKTDPSSNKDERVKKRTEQTAANENTSLIQASELNIVGEQNTEIKKLLGQKAALNIQLNRFEKELELDDIIQGHAEKREALLKEAEFNQGQVSKLSQLKSDLKESYQIDDNSREEQDLQLLEKKLSGMELTKEEQARLDNMGPLTDYQKQALEYNKMAKVFQKRADDAVSGTIKENQIISAIKLERLKSSPMVEANRAAEELLQQVDEEVKKMLAQEVMTRVRDNLDIEEEELLLTNPQALIEKKKVTQEDIKGLAVDEIV